MCCNASLTNTPVFHLRNAVPSHNLYLLPWMLIPCFWGTPPRPSGLSFMITVRPVLTHSQTLLQTKSPFYTLSETPSSVTWRDSFHPSESEVPHGNVPISQSHTGWWLLVALITVFLQMPHWSLSLPLEWGSMNTEAMPACAPCSLQRPAQHVARALYILFHTCWRIMIIINIFWALTLWHVLCHSPYQGISITT